MRFATFNLLHGRSIDDGLVVPGRLTDAVRSLDADVLALQEVDRHQDRSGSIDMTAVVADAMGAAAFRFVPALTGTPGFAWQAAALDEPPGEPAYGIGLVSRHPVVDWQPIALGASPARLPLLIEGPRRRVLFVKDEPRVAVAAVLAPGAPVRTVVAAHLSFAPGANIVQLRRLRRASPDLPRPLLLLGDLNLPHWAVRGAARLASAGSGGDRSVARAPDPARPRAAQADRATGATPSVRFFEAVRAPVSDHRALVVDLA